MDLYHEQKIGDGVKDLKGQEGPNIERDSFVETASVPASIVHVAEDSLLRRLLRILYPDIPVIEHWRAAMQGRVVAEEFAKQTITKWVWSVENEIGMGIQRRFERELNTIHNDSCSRALERNEIGVQRREHSMHSQRARKWRSVGQLCQSLVELQKYTERGVRESNEEWARLWVSDWQQEITQFVSWIQLLVSWYGRHYCQKIHATRVFCAWSANANDFESWAVVYCVLRDADCSPSSRFEKYGKHTPPRKDEERLVVYWPTKTHQVQPEKSWKENRHATSREQKMSIIDKRCFKFLSKRMIAQCEI